MPLLHSTSAAKAGHVDSSSAAIVNGDGCTKPSFAEAGHRRGALFHLDRRGSIWSVLPWACSVDRSEYGTDVGALVSFAGWVGYEGADRDQLELWGEGGRK